MYLVSRLVANLTHKHEEYFCIQNHCITSKTYFIQYIQLNASPVIHFFFFLGASALNYNLLLK